MTGTAKPGANPFERFGLDPRDGPQAITDRPRELAEDAATTEEREAIRAAWEELTLHPARRLRAAFTAAPETRPAIGRPPPRPPSADGGVTLFDLAPRPSVAEALRRSGADPPLPSLADDPALARPKKRAPNA